MKNIQKIIEKKVYSEYFDKIISGEKTFEVRLANWNCTQGDILILKEINTKTKKSTGRTLQKRVGYVGKTKDFNFWKEDDIDKYGYQIISLLDY